MVRGRLREFNGEEITAERRETHESLRRELNLSWAQKLPTGNSIVAGRWWGPSSEILEGGDVPVSIETDYVLIELGANDGLRGHPLRLLRANIEQMIMMCQNKNIQPLLFGMEIPANYGRRYSGDFAEIYPSLASEFEIPLMPFQFKDLATTKTMIQADGLHPSLEAQTVIKARVKSFLTPILQLKPSL